MVKVAVVQISSAGTAKESLNNMIFNIEEAARKSKDLDVIVFPEYCYYHPTNSSESDKNGEYVPGAFTEKISELARRYQVNIIPGSFVEKEKSGKVYNTSVFINREGKILGKYQKIHLFDAINIKESDKVKAGEKICVIETDIGKIGIMVCYDLRFPELARSMVLKGADILFVPSDFPTGSVLPPRTDHWDILVRSTALYNLTYVVAANQYGMLHGSYPFGRSCIVDPWGTVISSASGRNEIIFANLDMDYQKEVRESVATWSNRKPEIYEL